MHYCITFRCKPQGFIWLPEFLIFGMETKDYIPHIDQALGLYNCTHHSFWRLLLYHATSQGIIFPSTISKYFGNWIVCGEQNKTKFFILFIFQIWCISLNIFLYDLYFTYIRSWYLYKMVGQNMLRTYNVKIGHFRF